MKQENTITEISFLHNFRRTPGQRFAFSYETFLCSPKVNNLTYTNAAHTFRSGRRVYVTERRKKASCMRCFSPRRTDGEETQPRRSERKNEREKGGQSEMCCVCDSLAMFTTAAVHTNDIFSPRRLPIDRSHSHRNRKLPREETSSLARNYWAQLSVH